MEKATSCYKRALRLSRLYTHRDLEAEILLHLGKIFAKDTQMTSIAKKCYEHAKRIYVDFNDLHSRKMANYLQAKLMADEITPLYMAMLKSSTTRYCAFSTCVSGRTAVVLFGSDWVTRSSNRKRIAYTVCWMRRRRILVTMWLPMTISISRHSNWLREISKLALFLGKVY